MTEIRPYKPYSATLFWAANTPRPIHIRVRGSIQPTVADHARRIADPWSERPQTNPRTRSHSGQICPPNSPFPVGRSTY